jgi:hypothetical protein
MAVQRGRSKRRGEAYSEYVESLNDARTKLADIFDILLWLLFERQDRLQHFIAGGNEFGGCLKCALVF